MIKIVLINHSFQSNYYARRWQLFAESYPDVDITLLTPDKFSWYSNKAYSYTGAQKMEGKNVDIENFHMRTFRLYKPAIGWCSPDFKRILLSIKPDVIYHLGTHTQLSLVQLSRLAEKYLPNCKKILFSMRGNAANIRIPKKDTSLRNYLRDWYMFFYRSIALKYINKHYDAVFCHYPDAVKCFRKEGYKGPIYMQTQVGVNTEWFHPDVDARNEIRKKYNLGDAFVFGSATRFTSDKGVDDILKALPSDGNWKYLMMGTGSPQDTARLNRIIEERDLQNKVIATGFVDWYEMTKYWNAVDCAIHVPRTTPHWEETFSLSVVQPMATAKPIIGNDSGSVPYQVGHQELVVPEGDINALRSKIEWMLNHKEKASEIGAKLYDYGLDSFSVKHLNELFYRTIMEDVLKGEFDEYKADMKNKI